MPQWYLDTGLPTADTDSDGIPDAWERRTFSDPNTPDSGLDRDGDGLTDLEEFAFGSDPRTFSTMGDGWSDKEKRDAGLGAVCRVTSAASLAHWLGWLGWSEQQWRDNTGTNGQGFVSGYADFVNGTPPYSQERGAADFWLVTRTDRPAWVTVGDALTTNSFPVRAGSGHVRIRAAYGGPVSLSLNPLPGPLAELPGATNGLWLCQMSVEPYRSNTVVFADNETPTVSGQPDSVDGILLLSPPPAAAVHSLTSPPPAATLQPLRMTDGAVVLGNGGWYCLCASVPPCDWPDYSMIGCDAVSMTMNEVAANTPVLSKEDAGIIYGQRSPCIQCTVTQTVANATYPFIYGKVIFSFRQCEAIGGFILGAEMNWPSHEPACYEYTGCGGIGCMCLDDGNTYVGFDHGLVNTRTLNHPAENPESDKYIQHCLGVVWSAQPLDLATLCASFGLDLAGWEVNGKRLPSSSLDLGAEPSDLEPTIFRVKMLQASNPDIVWDRLFIVVNNRTSKAEYDNWVTQWSESSNRIWLRELPDAFLRLGLNNSDPEPRNNEWFPPKPPPLFYHHIATFDMRSKRTIHDHGNQACYNSVGQIISSGVSAGTADYSAPISAEHVLDDVDPFIRALQLDGNPCRKNRMPVTGWSLGTELDHAIIRQGLNTSNYLYCRPPSTGVLEPESP